MSNFLKPEELLKLIELGPLVSIDLLITNHSGKLLVGMRKNKPALGYWFVPGGRIRKGQSLGEAFAKITNRELGKKLKYSAARFVGAYTHIYDENFAGKENISTHYVVLAYMVSLDLDLSALPTEQHSEYRWLESENATDANSGMVHENVVPYFGTIRDFLSQSYYSPES